MSGAAGALKSIADRPPASAVAATIAGRCPRCRIGALFAGPVRFADRCPACGLDYQTFNVGDGPAAFLTLGIGTLVLVLALLVEFGLHPPVVVHLVLWPVVTVAAVLAGLRVAKAALIAADYRTDAQEGRVDGGGR